MKAPHPFRGRKPRLTAGDAPRLELHGPSRSEHDLLGEREVPGTALYGVQTLRAMENFAISGVELHEFPTLIAATAAVKEAAAEANRELGLLDNETAEAVIGACREIRNGRHHEHFRVD